MQNQKKGEWSKLASIDLTESWKVIISSIWNTFIDSVHVTYPVPHTQHGPRGPSTGIQGQETLVHGKEPRNVEGFHHYLKTRFFLAESVLKKNFFIIIKCVFSNILRGIALIGHRLYLTCNIFSLFPAGFRVASAIRTGLSSDLIRRSWSYIYLQICSMSSQLVTTPLSMG